MTSPLPESRTRRRALILALVVVLGTLVVASIAELAAGARALAECDAALARGDTASAILAAHDAADARAPGSPYPERGAARLASIARAAEAKGDLASAARAWRALRSSAIATRAAEAPPSSVSDANEGLERLAAREHRRETVGLTEPASRAAPFVGDSLALDETPRTSAFVVLSVGAACLLWGALRLLAGRSKAQASVPVSRREL